eukprot:1710019-Amphidinium_carterae.1
MAEAKSHSSLNLTALLMDWLTHSDEVADGLPVPHSDVTSNGLASRSLRKVVSIVWELIGPAAGLWHMHMTCSVLRFVQASSEGAKIIMRSKSMTNSKTLACTPETWIKAMKMHHEYTKKFRITLNDPERLLSAAEVSNVIYMQDLAGKGPYAVDVDAERSSRCMMRGQPISLDESGNGKSS